MKIKGKRNNDIKVEGLGRWKGKGKEKGWRKCKFSKNEYNLMSTIFFYFNLSKILHFLFFKTKRDRKYQ